MNHLAGRFHGLKNDLVYGTFLTKECYTELTVESNSKSNDNLDVSDKPESGSGQPESGDSESYSEKDGS